MHSSRGNNLIKLIAITVIFGLCVFLLPRVVRSETTADLKDQIITIAQRREAMETEMQTYADQQKFLSDKISAAEQSIRDLEVKKRDNGKELRAQQRYLSEYLRVIYEEDQTSFFEQLIKARTFSDFVDKNEYYNTIRDKFKATVEMITNIKVGLAESEEKLEIEKKVLEITKTAYQKQINEKGVTLNALREEEKRVRDKFADRLSQAGGSPYCKSDGKIVRAKYPVFRFPIDCGYISQGFGNTAFASVDNAYNGAIHNGVDVGVVTGTEIKPIGRGIIYAKGASPSGGWGNWVMVKHDKIKINIGGKDQEFEYYSLYGHMVAETMLDVGARVDENTLLGWVGGTPYWAPHLHFTLFASSSGWGVPTPNTIGPYPGNAIDPLDYMDIPISVGGTDWDPNYAHPFL
jgi:murein DD-endopeptidase MepM/ murein hydrolase activator NlpD